MSTLMSISHLLMSVAKQKAAKMGRSELSADYLYVFNQQPQKVFYCVWWTYNFWTAHNRM